MGLTKEQIIQSRPALRRVELPEWGGHVYVRSLTLGEQADLADRAAANEAAKRSLVERTRDERLRAVIYCTVNENGERLFSDADIEWLMGCDARVIDRLQAAILEQSGLTAAAQTALEKN